MPVVLLPGTPVWCADGPCGVIERVLSEAPGREPVGFVLKTDELATGHAFVPLQWVRSATPTAVRLLVTRAEVLRQQPPGQTSLL